MSKKAVSKQKTNKSKDTEEKVTKEIEVIEEVNETSEDYQEETREKVTSTRTESNSLSGTYFGLGTRVILSLVSQIFFITVGILALMLASNNMVVHNFIYNETSSLDYQVCYIENDFFPDECIPRGRQYVANLINYVEMNFNYNFNGSDLFNYSYTYSITATVIANERGQAERVLFDREDIVLEERTVNMTDSTGFTINEDIRIDYRYFNNIINNFRREYVLLLDSRIIVTLNVIVDGEHPNIEEPIQINRNITFEIPLSEQTLDVRMVYENVNSSYVMHSENENELLSMMYYVLAVISFIIALALIIRLIRLLLRISSPKSSYKKRIDKIMREYGLVIVKTKTVPEITSQKVFELTSIEELLDVQNVLQKPIMFIRIHAEKSCFMIMSNEETYRYIMKATDIENESNK